MRVVQIESTGGAEVLRTAEVALGAPAAGQVRVRVAFAGVNFIDVYQRSGLYPIVLPAVLGMEGSGVIEAVGPEVTDFAVGDRVAWADQAGSYADQLLASADRLVPVPDTVGLEVAAALMLQGLTAQYLIRDSYRLRPGDKCLIHAGAGGVGTLLIQLAKLAGAEVFTTVSTADKAAVAAAAGADHVINYAEQDFAAEVTRIAGPKALAAIYDGVGRVTFTAGLGLLRTRGTMVTFGNSSGPVEPFSPLVLSQGGSLFLTRPTLFHHIETTRELRERSAEIFDLVGAGKLKVARIRSFPLADAEAAHRELESRKSIGKLLLKAGESAD